MKGALTVREAAVIAARGYSVLSIVGRLHSITNEIRREHVADIDCVCTGQEI